MDKFKLIQRQSPRDFLTSIGIEDVDNDALASTRFKEIIFSNDCSLLTFVSNDGGTISFSLLTEPDGHVKGIADIRNSVECTTVQLIDTEFNRVRTYYHGQERIRTIVFSDDSLDIESTLPNFKNFSKLLEEIIYLG